MIGTHRSMERSTILPMNSKESLSDPMAIPIHDEGNTIYVYSSISPQIESRHRNAPLIPFPVAPRELIAPIEKKPGPGEYEAPSSIGKIVTSNNPTEPEFSIAGREKFGSIFNTDDSKKSPGPAAYKVFNPDIIMKKESAYTIGIKYKEPIMKERRPAPGEYALPSTLSSKTTTFGNSDRPPLYNKTSCPLGPGQYKEISSLGKMVESNKESLPMPSFPKDRRFKPKVQPSTKIHTKPISSIGKQIISNFKTGPSASISGRTKFGSFYGW